MKNQDEWMLKVEHRLTRLEIMTALILMMEMPGKVHGFLKFMFGG